MELIDIIKEQFLSAEILLKNNLLYAANTLLCACFYSLNSLNPSLAKKIQTQKYKDYIKSNITDIDLQPIFEQTNCKSREEFEEKLDIIFHRLAKNILPAIPNELDTNIKFIYNKSKHGIDKPGDYDKLSSTSLTKEMVEDLHCKVQYMLSLLIKKNTTE